MQFEYLDSKNALLDILTEIEFEDQIRQASERDDVSEVTVEQLSPGLSGAAVFLIRRLSHGGPLIPLVAKACRDEKLLITERDNFQRFIQNRLPEAPVLVRASPRLLLFTFGGPLANRRPVTLRSGYASSSRESLVVLMGRIVDSLGVIQTISPDTVSCLQRMPLIQKLAELSTLPLAAEVRSRLMNSWHHVVLQSDAIPAIRSTAHGDLNAGNILFEPGPQPSYPVFIDFASMKRSKDNVAYQAEGFHLPFWDYAKLERDIQTRLFLKEAIDCRTPPNDIILAIREANDRSTATVANNAIEKLLETTSALRKRIYERHSRDDLRAYRPVLAYSMLSVLFRGQPDGDIPHDLQLLVAAEASIALLSNTVLQVTPYSRQSTGRAPEPAETYVFVGRDDDVVKLRKILTAQRKPGTNRTVVVHGISGVGKSTLARVLARDASLHNHFPDGVLWASLGPFPVATECLRQWHKELTRRELPECGPEDAKNIVAKELENQARLLIIDDVWNAKDLDHIPSGGIGCVRLVTSRHTDLARHLGIPARDEHHLRMLSPLDGFTLLDELAHHAIQGFESEARLLVDALEGLPLALQVAGRLLRAEHWNKYTVKQLLDELRDGRALLDKECPENMRDLVSQTLPTVALVLRKSTDRLDHLTRERFAWLGQVAPKPAVFEIDLLRKLWKEPGEDSVRTTIRTLVDRGLMEPVDDEEFWMHGLFVALADSLLEK